jgi:hypothetical protein
MFSNTDPTKNSSRASGNTHKTSTSNNNNKGVGFGGSLLRSQSDWNILRRERTTVVVRQSRRDQEHVTVLIAQAALLRRQGLRQDHDDYTQLVTILKQVFTDVVPMEWERRMKVIVLSLTCLGLLVHPRPQQYQQQQILAYLGNLQDTESLAHIYIKFSQPAIFISQHPHNGHPRLVERILKLRGTIMRFASSHPTTSSSSTLTSNKDDTRLGSGTIPKDRSCNYVKETMASVRFQILEVIPNHVFASKPQSPKLNIRKLFQELSSLPHNLPTDPPIFVRAMEGRFDLLRVLITGPEGTPYAHGSFLFDVYLHDYPRQPPQVKFLTTNSGTVRFNPNLYEDGKASIHKFVCICGLASHFYTLHFCWIINFEYS